MDASEQKKVKNKKQSLKQEDRGGSKEQLHHVGVWGVLGVWDGVLASWGSGSFGYFLCGSGLLSIFGTSLANPSLLAYGLLVPCPWPYTAALLMHPLFSSLS